MFMYTRNGYDASHCWKVFVLSVKTSVNQKTKTKTKTGSSVVHVGKVVETNLDQTTNVPNYANSHADVHSGKQRGVVSAPVHPGNKKIKLVVHRTYFQPLFAYQPSDNCYNAQTLPSPNLYLILSYCQPDACPDLLFSSGCSQLFSLNTTSTKVPSFWCKVPSCLVFTIVPAGRSL